MSLDLGGVEPRPSIGPKAAQLAKPAGSRLTGVGNLFWKLPWKQTLRASPVRGTLLEGIYCSSIQRWESVNTGVNTLTPAGIFQQML